MRHFGFSYIGALWLAMLFVPNLLWARALPQGYSSRNESRALLLCERVGEVLVSCCAVCFSDFNLGPLSPWCLWLAASFLLMVLNEVWWLRYFRGPRRVEDFYRGMLGIPVPAAVLPVAAFLLLGIYGRVLWMVLAVLVLGVGHIGIHLGHLKELEAGK